MELIKGKTPKSWLATIVGVPGCGKSTLAAYAPKPVFVNVEDGLDRIDCVRTPLVETYEKLREALVWVKDAKEFQTVVIDGAGSVEKLLIQKMLDEVNEGRPPAAFVTSIADTKAFPFGAGGEILASKWALVIKALENIKKSGKNVILIGHQAIATAVNPEGEDYKQYSMEVHKKALPLIVQRMDAIFFAYYDKGFKTKGSGENAEKVPVATGKRMLRTIEQPFSIGKNRFGLPETLPFNSEAECRSLFGAMR